MTIALGLAGLVNAAILVMAAAAFNHAGLIHIASIQEAYRTLEPLLGPVARWAFAISTPGLRIVLESAVGTIAGQVIMQGFLHRHIPLWIRRLVTIIPSLVVIGLGMDVTRTLVISQVLLKFWPALCDRSSYPIYPSA